MSELDHLWAACEADPDDWTLLEVMADALEESGDEKLSHTFRWMAKQGCRPYNSHYGPKPWKWSPRPDHQLIYSYLPDEIFDRLGAEPNHDLSIKTYSTYHEAIHDLASALEDTSYVGR